jgi:N-sulfoglucosamine sulfohydrolase
MLGQRKLTSYLERPLEELYDLDEDPNEVHNLAADPKHQERLRSMRAATEEWQLATGDLWLYRDGVSLRLVQHHIDAGLKVPDRFDIDVANPTNQV